MGQSREARILQLMQAGASRKEAEEIVRKERDVDDVIGIDEDGKAHPYRGKSITDYADEK